MRISLLMIFIGLQIGFNLLFEAEQVAIPVRLEEFHPVHDFPQRGKVRLMATSAGAGGPAAGGGIDAEAMEPAGFDPCDKPGVLEHLEMPGDGRGGYGKGPGELGDGTARTRNPEQDAPAGGIGERAENAVEIAIGTINHVVKC